MNVNIKELYDKYRDDIFKPVIVLLAICIIIPLALSVTNAVTKDKIAALDKKNQEKAMARVMEADEYLSHTLDTDGGEVEYFTAENDGKTKGYIFITAAQGYGGEVSVITAIGTDSTVNAVEVLDASSETPGLGQNTARSSFWERFKGKKSGITVVKSGAAGNEIDAVTGATISSKAVTSAVNSALGYFDIIMENKLSGVTDVE